MDLLRHGALEGGVKYRGSVDDPLTSEGRQQMNTVWSRLDGGIDLIISSPLCRCAEPAWVHEIAAGPWGPRDDGVHSVPAGRPA